MESTRLASLTAREVECATRSFRSAAPHHQSLVFCDVSLFEGFTTAQKEAAFVDDKSLPPRRAAIIAATTGGSEGPVVYQGHAPIDAKGAPPVMRVVPRVQPAMSPEEYELAERLIREYGPFQAACARFGLDARHVRSDPWCVGWASPEDDPETRLCEPVLFYQEDPEDDLYARPLEGIVLRVDLWHPGGARVISMEEDTRNVRVGARPLHRVPDFAAEALRPRLTPLLTMQPEGPSFELRADGSVVWQRWSFVVGFNAREGCFLSKVEYAGRPVAWRLSFAEMVVPYGDPHSPHYRKAAFDAGEDGLGRNAHSLDPDRCDCAPGGSPEFLDACVANPDGTAHAIANAVCVHEEDAGLAWKHLDWRTGKSVARRGRNLVVEFITTIANYTYGFSFRLGTDAAIKFEAALTGILSLGTLGPPDTGDKPRRRPWGQTLNAEGLYAPDHQHFFVGRLDLCVDGLKNRLVEVETERLGAMNAYAHGAHDFKDAPGSDLGSDHQGEAAFALRNLRFNAFRRKETLLATELEAARWACPEKGRHWKVEAAGPAPGGAAELGIGGRLNAAGKPTAWRLEPGSGSGIRLACGPNAAFLSRAGFLGKNLWCTVYSPEERYPGGDFPNQRPPNMPDGLPAWTSARNASLDGADLVLWHGSKSLAGGAQPT